ncbi:hypothetical protein LCGC14_1035480 [marine sediment metagenome]|uniref:Uncharacterized protein n=1 Tax=marine sediment metagenome TaxID=412755 RepID=A0A0F9MTD8_9ZZZZ
MGKEKCSKKVWNQWQHYLCSRYAVKDGYCKQHHPDGVAKRKKISDDKWKVKMYNEPLSVARRKIEALEKEIEDLKNVRTINNFDEAGVFCAHCGSLVTIGHIE